ncbi:MAG: glycosyltransferase [Melioribacteraceae bacterium]|nr:glycosyltransferase [Melioribacteraceae bacterium]
MDIKYSVIIPTLNEEKLLPNLLQQFSNELRKKYKIEIIVADSGSKDKTIEIAKEKCDKVIEKNGADIKNISFGRYIGAKNSTGEILIFLNADVLFDDINYFFEYLENNFVKSIYVACTCKIKVFPNEEKFIDKIFSAFINCYVHALNSIGIGMMRGECQIIRKSVYENVGGYNINLYAGEDFEISTRIRKKGKILFAKNLIIYESPRRYHSWGYIKILFSWFLNSISSWFLKKSFNKKWEEIR